MAYEYLKEEHGIDAVVDNVALYLQTEYLLKRVVERDEIDDESFAVTCANGGVVVWVTDANKGMVRKAMSFFADNLGELYGFGDAVVGKYNVWTVRRGSSVKGSGKRVPTGPGFGSRKFRINEERKQIEVSLDRSDTEMRARVKDAGFRWYHAGGFWYARYSDSLRDLCKVIGLTM